MASRRSLALLTCAAVWLNVAAAHAQTEEIEPRVVGGSGLMSIGVSGFVDTFRSSEDTFPLNATLQVEVTRFLTNRFAARGGLVGAARLGDEETDESPTGPGTTALDALAGVYFYFTPESMVSVYAGPEYRMPLTERAEREAGTLLGMAGVDAAVSSRTSVFVEGGYGFRFTRGDGDELQTRIVGKVGFRIRF